jgi:hypothetical protein
MNLFQMFGVGAARILAKDCSVKGTVTTVRKSYLYVIKKPVRLYPSERNTLCSHFITFAYTVNGIPYSGKLFITPYHRCPQKGEQINVYYDPEKPENYACYSFGPASRPIGW